MDASTQRQEVLILWLAHAALDAPVVGWSHWSGTGEADLDAEATPYATGVAALADGWRLLQITPTVAPSSGPGSKETLLRHEYVFERFVPWPRS